MRTGRIANIILCDSPDNKNAHVPPGIPLRIKNRRVLHVFIIPSGRICDVNARLDKYDERSQQQILRRCIR